ncbi:hypothetical protein [Halotia branconii]|uniref:Uncharacterized protein n=1 Tax=Halotia branconii CENA392 TaxID=1539056 RepID=A0AAJ6NYR6_9CYAN|nr:hypothetical protein [Halotia branconii]WGV29122.1 hypothetical protein QI031_30430 [Halotia branconii CENA392]
MKSYKLNTATSYIPTPQEQIKALRMHLSMPWKQEAKTWAQQELEQLLVEYGEPKTEFKPKQLSLF